MPTDTPEDFDGVTCEECGEEVPFTIDGLCDLCADDEDNHLVRPSDRR